MAIGFTIPLTLHQMTDHTNPTDGQLLFERSEFEQMGQENGQRYWWESDVCRMLGYKPGQGFEKAVGRAMASCTVLGIPVIENFRQEYREVDDDTVADTKLSRFACYLIAMNGDPRKTEVAQAQAYFITWAHAAEKLQGQLEGVVRVVERDDVTNREKALSSAAQAAGVVSYALFQSEGYRGLYNMNLARLKAMKGIPDNRTALDFMGREEMAANLFRITQTEAKIRNEGVRGQAALEHTAFSVGKQVRSAIEEIGGTMPEQLAAHEDIKRVRSSLKQTSKSLKAIDTKKLPKPKK